MVKAKLEGTSGQQGKRELRAYLNGQALSRKQAMLAKCYECMGHYDDGRADCEIVKCPIYPFMPYGKAEYKHNKRPSRKLSEEHKQKMLDGRKAKGDND